MARTTIAFLFVLAVFLLPLLLLPTTTATSASTAWNNNNNNMGTFSSSSCMTRFATPSKSRLAPWVWASPRQQPPPPPPPPLPTTTTTRASAAYLWRPTAAEPAAPIPRRMSSRRRIGRWDGGGWSSTGTASKRIMMIANSQRRYQPQQQQPGAMLRVSFHTHNYTTNKMGASRTSSSSSSSSRTPPIQYQRQLHRQQTQINDHCDWRTAFSTLASSRGASSSSQPMTAAASATTPTTTTITPTAPGAVALAIPSTAAAATPLSLPATTPMEHAPGSPPLPAVANGNNSKWHVGDVVRVRVKHTEDSDTARRLSNRRSPLAAMNNGHPYRTGRIQHVSHRGGWYTVQLSSSAESYTALDTVNTINKNNNNNNNKNSSTGSTASNNSTFDATAILVKCRANDLRRVTTAAPTTTSEWMSPPRAPDMDSTTSIANTLPNHRPTKDGVLEMETHEGNGSGGEVLPVEHQMKDDPSAFQQQQPQSSLPPVFHPPPPTTIFNLDELIRHHQYAGESSSSNVFPAASAPNATTHASDNSSRTPLDPSLLQSFSTPSTTTNPGRFHTPEYLEQLEYFSTVSSWVVFTDLHCSSSTLDTCRAVLDIVHEQALQRKAGVLFLGDWWHVRGSIRVDLLNAMLETLSHWTQPMIMIPGNHDQVTATCSNNHGLTPLQHAYRIPVPSTFSFSHTSGAAAATIVPATTLPNGIDEATTDNSGTAAAIAATTLPGVLIFSHPTIFCQALWIPHIRSSAVLESVLQSPQIASEHVRVIFCHADVTGASMNDNLVSNGGVSPSLFPPNIPIYSGHFHKPHVLTTNGNSKNTKEVRRIEYLGSPYEVSLSEAQQPKSLAVFEYQQQQHLPQQQQQESLQLNHCSWACVDRIPIHVGRHHFRLDNVNDFLALWVSSEETTDEAPGLIAARVHSGDRVVFYIDKEEWNPWNQQESSIDDLNIDCKTVTTNTHEIDEHILTLRNAGVLVEIRDQPVKDWNKLTAATSSDNKKDTLPQGAGVLEDMSTASLWKSYMENQLLLELISNATFSRLFPFGADLLEDMEKGKLLDGSTNGATVGKESSDDEKITPITDVMLAPFTGSATIGSKTSVGFQLDSVSVQGFGPFCETVTYPLLNRGLVLLRGSNKDDGSDSNGTGKTSLAMSILWALTGTVDPRPFQDAKVSDIVNDDSRAAVVTVRGSINGVTFIVSRTKTSSKTGLVFMYDERDLTTQSGKETQELIFDKLGINLDILSRTMFHGQHGMNDLLEATDAKLKDELSLVIRLSVWQQAVIHCRKKGREAGKQVSEFDGKVAIRLMDLSKLQTNLDNAKFVYKSQKARLAETKDRLRNDIDTLSQIASKRLLNAGNFEEDISDERSAVQLLETERATFGESNDVALAAFRAELDVAAADLLRGERECHDREQIVNDAKVHVNVVKERVVNFQNIWKVDLLSSNSFAESRPLDSLVLPEHCPTCHQNLSVLDDHSHSVDGSRESMTLTLQNDANSLLFDMQGAQAAWDKAREVVQLVRGSHQQTIDKIAMIQTRLEEHRHNADRVFQDLEIRIKEATALEHEAWAASYVAAMASENKYQLEVQTQIQSIESTIASEESFYDRSVQTVDRVYSEWQECNECVAEMQKERTMHEQSALLMGELVDAFGPRGIQTFVLRGAVLALESSTQYYLDELSDGSQQLQLNLETGDRISRRAFVRSGSNSRSNKNENVTNNGFKERPLATLSGGQWRRCSLALTMAFAELIASKSHFCPSLVVWDEPLTHLDQTGRASVGRVFRSLLRRTTEQQQRQTATTLPSSTRPAVAGLQVSTILLILQDLAAVELEECFDCIDDVVKENGISKVYTDEE